MVQIAAQQLNSFMKSNIQFIRTAKSTARVCLRAIQVTRRARAVRLAGEINLELKQATVHHGFTLHYPSPLPPQLHAL